MMLSLVTKNIYFYRLLVYLLQFLGLYHDTVGIVTSQVHLLSLQTQA